MTTPQKDTASSPPESMEELKSCSIHGKYESPDGECPVCDYNSREHPESMEESYKRPLKGGSRWRDSEKNRERKRRYSEKLKAEWASGKRKGIVCTEQRRERIRKANTGKKMTEDAKKKLSMARMGIKFSAETRKKMSAAKVGRKLSPETLRKLSISKRGDRSWNWQGGITPLYHAIRRSFEYRQWLSDVFTRDDFTCQECGLRGCVLNAHHIKEFVRIIKEYDIKTIEQARACEELWNINNGITLCVPCHKKTKTWGRPRAEIIENACLAEIKGRAEKSLK